MPGLTLKQIYSLKIPSSKFAPGRPISGQGILSPLPTKKKDRSPEGVAACLPSVHHYREYFAFLWPIWVIDQECSRFIDDVSHRLTLMLCLT
jgi:hypothetical protein